MCNAVQIFTVYSCWALKLLFNYGSLTKFLMHLDSPFFFKLSFLIFRSFCMWVTEWNWRAASVRNKRTANLSPELKSAAERRVSSAEEQHKLCWKPNAVERFSHPLNTTMTTFSRLKENGEGLLLSAVLQRGHTNPLCISLHLTLLKFLLQFIRRSWRRNQEATNLLI